MIDIIIPVYNAHDTIIKTLVSVAMQSIKDEVTVYLVDDNSIIDYSQEIKFFKGKLKIKQYILNKNRGPGFARQYALERSHGEFVLFLDGDDYLDHCFSLELLRNALLEGNDYVHGTILEEHDKEKLYYSNFQNSLHGKMYRREFIVNNKIIFNDSRYHEDNAFNRLFLLAKPRTKKIDEVVYIYRNNKKSVTKADEDYEFTHLHYLVENRMWVFKCAEERGFKNKDIAELIFDTFMTMFTQYNMYIRRPDSYLILKMCVPLEQILLEYNKYISDDYKNETYHAYTYAYIPQVSVNEFARLIEEYSGDYYG